MYEFTRNSRYFGYWSPCNSIGLSSRWCSYHHSCTESPRRLSTLLSSGTISIRHLTACQEFAHLHQTPTLFSFISSRSRSLRSRNPFLCAFFLLCGDVEPNPVPINFTLCTLNIRSILQPLTLSSH